jgi:aspartate carbamoyltransferase catalytic subunit
MDWKKKDLLGIEDLTPQEINYILDTSVSFKEVSERPIKKVPTLRGKTIVNLFFEPSTRTRISFELAEKRLSADIINFSTATSSVLKDETLLDTARNIEAMKIDAVVVRHSGAGMPHFLAKKLPVPVINAGDGAHEHPTQALLDMFTMREHKGKLKGLKVAIVGDIRFSRVARSNIWGLTKMGAEVFIVAPPTFIPPYLGKIPVNPVRNSNVKSGLVSNGVKIFHSLDEVISKVDVLMALRIQKERQKASFFSSIREYRQIFGITSDRLKKARKNVLVMHPGPINRGVEIDPEVADSKNSVILEQVTNGVAVRMALLYILLGGQPAPTKGRPAGKKP